MYNILFISTDFNYFIDNNASFHRMYNNLMYFHHHKNFCVLVLQPYRERERENLNLKQGIKCYYFKELRLLGNTFVPFVDFNPFYILKIYKILKKYHIDLIHVDFVYGINCLRLLRKTPISYNAHNVEAIYVHRIGKYYYKLPFFLRSIFTKYIYFLEKGVLKLVKNINAISQIDKRNFINIYNVSFKKIIVNGIGYKKSIFEKPIRKKIARERLNLDKKKFLVIFHGNYFSHGANREAIEIIRKKIIHLVKDKDILFLIAGKTPQFKNTENLQFLGYLDDLGEFLYAADIAIVPILRGSGIRTKIVDYISATLPVITSKQGIEGLVFKNNIHGYIVDNPIEGISKKIIELKNNPDKITEFKRNIKNLNNKYYNWEKILEKIALRYELIINSSE